MGGASPPPPMPATVPSESSKSRGDDGFDSSQIVKVKAWLISQFDAAGKDFPDFEYTPQSIALLHNIATLSQARTKAASIITNDFRQKALEYHSQVARLREVMEDVGLVQESLPANVVSSAQVLASVVLNIRDTELSRLGFTSYLYYRGGIMESKQRQYFQQYSNFRPFVVNHEL